MHVIIAGGGLIGRGLGKKLADNKHDVVIIDKSMETCESIYEEIGAVTIVGNAIKIETLENAHIDKCDVAVASMRDDSDNLGFAVLAKHFNVPQVLVRMNDPKYESIYKSIGVYNTGRTSELLINQFMVTIETPELLKHFFACPFFSLFSFTGLGCHPIWKKGCKIYCFLVR